MPLAARRINPPNIIRNSQKSWLHGVVTAYQDGRTPVDGLRSSGNMILDQDGTLRPRPSLVRYGTQPPGTILGEVFEFSKTVAGSIQASGLQNWMMAMMNVGGTIQPYITKDGGAWQVCNGNTYSNVPAHFVEIDEKVIIMNGTERVSFLDITTAGSSNTITTFTQLNAPVNPTASKNTGGSALFMGTTLTYYIRITANSTFGESAESTVAIVTTGSQRASWNATTDFLSINWTAPSNATASTTYNVYISTVQGQEALVVRGLNGTSYKDTGADPQNFSIIAPAFDNTLGPRTTRGAVVNGQLFMTGDTDHPRTVWYGGTGKAVLDFSLLNGGGSLEIGRGTKDIPVRVVSFRDHAGRPVIAVLCQSTNGRGKRYTLTPNTITAGNTTVSFFNVEEDSGNTGTDSPDAVIPYNDSLWYPSRDGFKTTGTKPQLQTFLSTDTMSETILYDVLNLNTAYMGKAVGLGWQNKLYYCLPNGSTTNNEIWVCDLQRGGAWMKPWNISADWMMLYNDNAGMTHHIVLSNNLIYELSYSASTNDDGVAFPTNATSGIIKFSEDGMQWARIINITFILLRPQGNISISVAGRTEDAELSTVGSTTLTPTSTVAGWGEAGWGGSPDLLPPLSPSIFGWSNFSVLPTVIGSARYPVSIDVDEELNYYSWSIDTSTIGADYQLSDVIAQYVNIGVKEIEAPSQAAGSTTSLYLNADNGGTILI